MNVAESDTSKDAQQDNFNNIECNRDDIENNVTNDNVITSAEASSENIGNSSNTSCGNLPQDLQTTDSYMGNDSSALRKEFEEFSRSSFQSHTLFDDIDNVLKDSDDLLNQVGTYCYICCVGIPTM